MSGREAVRFDVAYEGRKNIKILMEGIDITRSVLRWETTVTADERYATVKLELWGIINPTIEDFHRLEQIEASGIRREMIGKDRQWWRDAARATWAKIQRSLKLG